MYVEAHCLGNLRRSSILRRGFSCGKSVSSKISVIGADDNGRFLCLPLKPCEVSLRIFSVHFPCHDFTAEYEIELGSCLGFIDTNIT